MTTSSTISRNRYNRCVAFFDATVFRRRARLLLLVEVSSSSLSSSPLSSWLFIFFFVLFVFLTVLVPPSSLLLALVVVGAAPAMPAVLLLPLPPQTWNDMSHFWTRSFQGNRYSSTMRIIFEKTSSLLWNTVQYFINIKLLLFRRRSRPDHIPNLFLSIH